MFMDSILTEIVSGGVARQSDGTAAECTFWTGRDGQMSVQHFRPVSEVFYPPHGLEEYTLLVCLAGEMEVEQLGQTLSISEGEAWIGNRFAEQSVFYQSGSLSGCEVVAVALDGAFMKSLTAGLPMPVESGDVCPVFLGKIQNPIVLECAREIASEMIQKGPGHKVVIETQAVRMLVEAFRAWPKNNIELAKLDSAQRLPRREFVRAFEYMRGCRKEDFRLQNLCRFLGMSLQRFTRLFFATTQHTPASFYNRLLLAQACCLLRNPDLSVKEIGFDLGFKTSSHFTASFRREFGASPQEYRQTLGWRHSNFRIHPLATNSSQN